MREVLAGRSSVTKGRIPTTSERQRTLYRPSEGLSMFYLSVTEAYIHSKCPDPVVCSTWNKRLDRGGQPLGLPHGVISQKMMLFPPISEPSSK